MGLRARGVPEDDAVSIDDGVRGVLDCAVNNGRYFTGRTSGAQQGIDLIAVVVCSLERLGATNVAGQVEAAVRIAGNAGQSDCEAARGVFDRSFDRKGVEQDSRAMTLIREVVETDKSPKDVEFEGIEARTHWLSPGWY